ncbi:MAG: hypothetical protein Q8933_08195 [Bacteroidota bacterium]|nr:hypothetical protein [Bacteroidota bacterium]MDP4190985.1 hypothetical protein [Bacteroidota bacterium]MDP4195124.1 hypothetical protein [Bacteroidota bacterium]
MALADNRKKKVNSSKHKSQPGRSAMEGPKLSASEAKPTAIKAGKVNTKLFYLVMILIPVLFFVLLESSLRIFNYGIDTREWIPATYNKIVMNPQIGHRYFYTTKGIPYPNPETFDKVKGENTYRVFVLGESSAAGYPYTPAASFSKYLKKRLEILYPSMKIEVINIAMTAINTYALRDMFPGVLDQKPDLILIYTGHNEYYGALGIGSMEYLGSNPKLVNFVLKLNRFKTVELLRNVIGSLINTFTSKKQSGESNGTLMSRIVKDQYIAYQSKQYKAGINQFESNMKDILQMAKEKKVPVILGTLASNLKDQAPFISTNGGGYPEASKIFKQAQEKYNSGNIHEAEVLFRKAKDLDELRFRAPEDINREIKNLAKEFSLPIAEIDSAFNKLSPGGIVGDNLMTDHLHPTLKGHEIMSEMFFAAMKKNNLLPKVQAERYDEPGLQRLIDKNFKFSRLDSLIAFYRIASLKNDWPFTDPGHRRPDSEIIKPKDYIDSLAVNFYYSTMDWEEAHRKAANWLISRKDFDGFKEQMEVLLEQFPVVAAYYDYAANTLLNYKRFDDAYDYFLRRSRFRPDATSLKWLGIIDLSKSKTDQAIGYLRESLHYDSMDTQVLYNLAGAYAMKMNYNQALETIDKCLEIDPSFPAAGSLKTQIVKALATKK